MPGRPKPQVDISVQRPFIGKLSRPLLRRAVTLTLKLASPGEPCQLGLVIAGDETVRDLNRDYRGLDEVTDVLSFATFHQGHWEGEGDPPPDSADTPFVLPPDEPRHLGEVVVSYPQAARQAGPGEDGLQKEMVHLVAHGVLHLLGFDHLEPQEALEMEALERQVLSLVLV